MADSLLISVSASRVSVAPWRRGGFGEFTVFDNDDNGLAAFKEYLSRAPQLPVHVVVDAVEEDYRFESLPHSYGRDRREMVSRKLKQHYRNTPYASAHMQGRDTGKRRDDRFLFCALINPDLITSWLQVITDRELPVAGVYLLPTVSAVLLEKFKITQPNLLLASVHESGMRLTFFRDQKLRLSRLARTEGSGADAVKNYAGEISNTRLYLHALRVMTLDEPLSVLIIDRDDTLGGLSHLIARDSPNIECRRLGRQEIISTIGIRPQALDSSTSALYLYLLGLRAPANNLAPTGVTLAFRQLQLGRAIYAFSGVTALAAVVWCALNLYQLFAIDSDIGRAKEVTADLQARYKAATLQFPSAPTTAENLRRAVEVAQRIGSTTRSPELMMDLISQALDSHPAIVVRSFGWKYDKLEIGSEPGAAKSGPATPAPAPANTGRRKQSGLIDGEVRPFRGDYRAAIEEIQSFAGTLSALPEVAEGRVIKLPLDIDQKLSLSGNTVESREQTGRAEFRLVVILKPTV